MTNAEFTKEIGRPSAGRRRGSFRDLRCTWCSASSPSEVLTGQRALPIVLHESGFEFTHRTLAEALAAELP